jgi:N4-gp56 family major capsid protein
MAVQTTSNLTNSITSIYKNRYLDGAQSVKLYDQVAVPYTELGADGKSMDELMRGSTIYVPFLSEMSPGTTAISQTADVTPQTLVDDTNSVTTTSIGEALQWSQQLEIQVYTDYTAKAYEAVGKNAMESIEILAYKAALAGTWVERAAARASLDAGTVSHRASDAIFRKYDGMMQSLKVPGYVDADGGSIWTAIMHPYVYHDISESGNVNAIGAFQNSSIHLNWELGQIGRFRLLSSPYAKVFGAAGADNASNWADLLGAAVTPLATTYTSTNTATNSAYGLFNWVGSEETSTLTDAGTFYPKNEPVKYVSGSTGTSVTIIGQGSNGGFKYSHTTSEYARNADSVYPVLFAGPKSLVKVFATNVGENGMTVGPKVDGLLDQFNSLGWKYYGGYGIISQNYLLRFECSTSYEA